MPAAWSRRDERQYDAIVDSCLERGDRSERTCKRIAASTVNKRHRQEGRTVSGLNGVTAVTALGFVGAAMVMWGVKLLDQGLDRSRAAFIPKYWGG